MLKIIGILVFGLASINQSFGQQTGGVSYAAVNWSPDGRYLTYTRMEMVNLKPPVMKAATYVMKSDGTEVKKLTGGEKMEFNPVWSKDGKRIYFGSTADIKESEIYSADRDGADLKLVTKNKGRNSAPSISPDGKRIVFNSENVAHKPQIMVMDIDGSNVKALTNDDSIAFYDPVWSRDGKKIVYFIDRGDKKDQIWLMNADGTDQTMLTKNIAHNFYPSWSSDGKRIIYCSNRDGEEQVIYSMQPDGLDIKRQMTQNGYYARMSPNGKKIAFISGKFPNIAIFVANTDGTNPIKVTP